MRSILAIVGCLLPIFLPAQNTSDIYLLDLSIKNGVVYLANPKNVTLHKGYDNQPFFSGSDMYYSSEDSGQMDIKKYNYRNGFTTRVTRTPENEFSPTVTPGKKYISCILQRKDGTQDLVKYPVHGGQPVLINNTLKTGYHTWVDKDHLLLFVLEDTATFGLHFYDVKKGIDKKITEDIGRSLQPAPGHKAGFIQKSKGEWMIMQFDPATQKQMAITATLPGRDLFTWSHDGILLMSDGNDIFYNLLKGAGWQKIKTEGMPLKNISRLAINADNTRLAVVASE